MQKDFFKKEIGLNSGIKNEIKKYKILLIIIFFVGFFLNGLLFGFNQYLNTKYKEKYALQKKEKRELQKTINKYESRIEEYLKGENIQKIKDMDTIYNSYFNNRYNVLPKVLILEMLEEILPPETKIAKSITIGEDTAINLILYSKTVDGLDSLYNKFIYYQNDLGLLKMKGFNTITLKKGTKKINKIIGKTKWAYKTTISLSINKKAVQHYYSSLLGPEGENHKFLKKYFGEDIIEPNNIPQDITIEQTILLHKKFNKKHKKNEEKLKGKNIENDEDF